MSDRDGNMYRQEIRRRLAALRLEPTRETEIVEELAQHLEDRFDELTAGGATEDDARRLALEELRDDRFLGAQLARIEKAWALAPVLGAPSTGSAARDLWQDLRFGARLLRKRPSFTATVVATLALGIGPLTAVFTLAYGVLMKPLPYRDPDRLVMVWKTNREKSAVQLPLSAPLFLDWQAGNQAFERMGAFASGNFNLTGQGEPEVIRGAEVSAGFLATLGVEPLLGRTFLPDEDKVGAAPAVVLGHGLWQRRFGGDAAVVGSQLTLDGRLYTVVGVMPAGFGFPADAQLWAAFAFDLTAPQFNPGNNFLAAVARLRPGGSRYAAQAHLETMASPIGGETPAGAIAGVNLVPLQEQVVGGTRTRLLVLLGAMGFVLLIACANVANLLLVRAGARRREVAIRAALGASRSRLVRQLLTEHVLLALLGGALGLALAAGGVALLGSLTALRIPRVGEVALDARVVAVVVAATTFIGLVFGSVSAFRISPSQLSASLREGAGRIAQGGGGRRRLRSALLVAQIALSFVLLVGAGLLVRSLANIGSVDPGFRPEGVLTVNVTLPGHRYSDMNRRIELTQQVVERLAAVPGVRSAAASAFLPMSGQFVSRRYAVDGRPLPGPGREPFAQNNAVSAEYFRTLRIPLVAGRAFTGQDGAQAPPVAIVNQAFARQTFPGENALGRRIRFYSARDPQPAFREIVGIVGDVRQVGLDADPAPEIYVPATQNAWTSVVFYLRVDGDPLGVAEAARSAIHAVDAEQPVSSIATLEQVLSGSFADRRGLALLLGLFAALALALSAIGIYGVMSDSVSQRTHEIGVRMAIGAQPADVLKLVVRQGSLLALLGGVLGLAGALLLADVMTGLLFGVRPLDPVTLLAVALVLGVVAVLACYVPARRATRIDPLLALRAE